MGLFKPPRRIVLLGGAPASGKSSCCAALKERGIICFDKDDLAGGLVDQALSEAGKDPGRRDSDLYTETLRPLEYEALLKAGEDCVGQSVVLSAPFIAQVQEEDFLSGVERCFPDAEVCLVWLDCPRREVMARMIGRALPRDAAKIDGREEYDHPRPPRQVAVAVLDSEKLSTSELADQVERLIKYGVAEPKGKPLSGTKLAKMAGIYLSG